MTQKLRGKMLQVIKMMAEGHDISEMERILKIRPSTITKWQRIPEFIARLEERKRVIAEIRENAKQGIMSSLMTVSGEAIRTQLVYKIHQDERFQNCLKVFRAVAPAQPKDAQTRTNLHKDAQTYTNLHKDAQTSTNLHEIGPKLHKKTHVSAELS